jgi:hypothetical protein
MPEPESRCLRAIVLASILGSALIVPASSQATELRRSEEARKPAWKWTLGERLDKRYDPVEIKSRAAEKVSEDAKIREMFKDMPGALGAERDFRADTIEGKTHPELFLPGELFDALLGDAFPSGKLSLADTRRHLDAPAAALGLGRDFWTRLRRVAAPYLDLQREDERLALEGARREPSAKRSDSPSHRTAICRARTDALAAAKAEFGEESFLRFLYEAVAPNLAISYIPDESSSDGLRFIEEGCR